MNDQQPTPGGCANRAHNIPAYAHTRRGSRMIDHPAGFEDPTVCAGIHNWMWHTQADRLEDVLLTCRECARVETWGEHTARPHRTMLEACGRFAAVWGVLWRRFARGTVRAATRGRLP